MTAKTQNGSADVGRGIRSPLNAVATLVIARGHILWPRWLEMAPAYAIGSIAMFWVLQRVVVLGGS